MLIETQLLYGKLIYFICLENPHLTQLFRCCALCWCPNVGFLLCNTIYIDLREREREREKLLYCCDKLHCEAIL